MIVGLLHSGSGLGDQLFRLITVRTLAQDKGFDYAMVGQFKGDFFVNQPNIIGEFNAPYTYNEKDVRDAYGNDIRSYDPEINFVKDYSIIDGSFEDSRYWCHNLENINKWLKVERDPSEFSTHAPDIFGLIGFRGGEYVTIPELFLPKEYFDKGIQIIREKSPNLEFVVHTDDPALANSFFNNEHYVAANEKISHSKHTHMAYNWFFARNAKYAVIPNSAFFILPRLLKHLEDPTAVTIAPRYWARRNTKGPWRPAAYYKEFTYI